MARKKKVTKKKISKKRTVRSSGKRTALKRAVKSKVTRKVVASKRKFRLVLVNLILFVGLSLISVLLYNIFSDEILQSFFFMSTIITGFIAVAFLITYLVLLFMRWFSK